MAGAELLKNIEIKETVIERVFQEIERPAGIIYESILKGGSILELAGSLDHEYNFKKKMNNASRSAFSQLCTEMAGMSELEGVVVIVATNRPQDIDTALISPGIFDRKIFFSLPD